MKPHTCSSVSGAVLGIATLASACATPRAAIVAGSVGTIAGATIIASIPSTPSCDGNGHDLGCGIGSGPQSISNAFGYLIGGGLLAVGVSLLVSGGIGLRMERDAAAAAPPPGPLPQVPAVDSPALDPADRARATTPADRVALQVHLAARAGHCQSAGVLAQSLAKLDPARLQALIAQDTEVARCGPYSYRM